MGKTTTEQSGEQHLYSKEEASRRLGNISLATIDKHIRRGNLKVTRIGRRPFLSHTELNRISREGLPSLSNGDE